MQNNAIYPGAILELQTTLMHLKKYKVFLVTGKKSFESCGAKEKIQWLFDSCEVTHFYDFQTNPDSKDVINGVQLFNQTKCEIIVSVGGGSVIDMAKLINYYHKAGIKTIEESNIKNDNPELVTHISLPTTAGSGAEATHFAVMYIGNTKYSIAHTKLIPDYAIIDPELHYSQTPYQKAVSGADALAQAIESFWSVLSTEESRLYSEKALELVWNNLPDVVHKGDNLAHLNMAVGANLAGRAINIAKTTAPHALAYGFTKYAGLPHGHAVALTLPYFQKAHSQINDKNCNDPRGTKHIDSIFARIKDIFKTNNSEHALKDFFNEINLDVDIRSLNLSKEILLTIIENINTQRLANNPLKINKKEIINFLINKEK